MNLAAPAKLPIAPLTPFRVRQEQADCFPFIGVSSRQAVGAVRGDGLDERIPPAAGTDFGGKLRQPSLTSGEYAVEAIGQPIVLVIGLQDDGSLLNRAAKGSRSTEPVARVCGDAVRANSASTVNNRAALWEEQ
jgi:hypothetical protein